MNYYKVQLQEINGEYIYNHDILLREENYNDGRICISIASIEDVSLGDWLEAMYQKHFHISCEKERVDISVD